MKITNDMIDKELIARGKVMNMIFKASNKELYIKLSKRFNKINKLSKKNPKDMILEKRWIKFRDSSKKSGIPVEFKIFKGCYHRFGSVNPKAKVSIEANKFLLKGFKYVVNNYFTE